MSRLRDLPAIGTIGRYQVLGRLAKGGMAEIFLAREDGPRQAWRPLVVKRILPHAAEDAVYVESFVHEATLSMRLRHPNICAVYEFGEERGTYYLAMEFVAGVSLRELLDRAGTLPIPLVVRVVADIAAALHHAHTMTDDEGNPLAIVHRDVTPENIMIGYDGHVKLLDFGIAKARSQTQKTQDGVLKGKTPYMSPEQYRGEEVDGRADLFSLGATLYEALTGTNPFVRASEAGTVAAILFEDAPPAPSSLRLDIPDSLDELCRMAVERDLAKRIPSGDAFARALETWLRREGEEVRPRQMASYLGGYFSEKKAAGPKLDRTPLEVRKVDPLASAANSAELDDFVGAALRAQKRKQATVVFVGAAIVLGVLGFFAWRLLTAPAPPPSSDAPVVEEPSG
ncbi:MAG: serine/threonine-protein kinase [Myxococcota bacterium]